MRLFVSFNSKETEKNKKIYASITKNEFIRKNFTVELQPYAGFEFYIFNEKIKYEIFFERYRNLLGLMGSNYMFSVRSRAFSTNKDHNLQNTLYFLEDDFESRQWLGGRIGSGDKLQWKLAIDHFPPNITNNIITLIEITYKLKKLTIKDFKNIWERTNFANPTSHYFPGLGD